MMMMTMMMVMMMMMMMMMMTMNMTMMMLMMISSPIYSPEQKWWTPFFSMVGKSCQNFQLCSARSVHIHLTQRLSFIGFT
eukprot:741894-Karenia_brevis.AAC.1